MLSPCSGLLCLAVLLSWLLKQHKTLFCGSYVNVIISNSSFFFNFLFFTFLLYFFIFLFFRKNKWVVLMFSMILVFCFLTILYRQYSNALFSSVGLTGKNFDSLGLKKNLNIVFDFSGPGLLHGISFLTTCCFFLYKTILFNFKSNINASKRFFGFFTKIIIILITSVYVLITGAYWAFFSAIWGNWYNNDIIEVFYTIFFAAVSLYLHTVGRPYSIYKTLTYFFVLTVCFLAALRFGLLNTKHTSSLGVNTGNTLWFAVLTGLTLFCLYMPKKNINSFRKMFFLNSDVVHNFNIDAGWLYTYYAFVFFFAITSLLVFIPSLFLFFYLSYLNFFFFSLLLSAFIAFTKMRVIKSVKWIHWKNLHIGLVVLLLTLLLFVWGAFTIERFKTVAILEANKVQYSNYLNKNTHFTCLISSQNNANTELMVSAAQLSLKNNPINASASLNSYFNVNSELTGFLNNQQVVYKKMTVFADSTPAANINLSVKNHIIGKMTFYRFEHDLVFFFITWLSFLLLFS